MKSLLNTSSCFLINIDSRKDNLEVNLDRHAFIYCLSISDNSIMKNENKLKLRHCPKNIIFKFVLGQAFEFARARWMWLETQRFYATSVGIWCVWWICFVSFVNMPSVFGRTGWIIKFSIAKYQSFWGVYCVAHIPVRFVTKSILYI